MGFKDLAGRVAALGRSTLSTGRKTPVMALPPNVGELPDVIYLPGQTSKASNSTLKATNSSKDEVVKKRTDEPVSSSFTEGGDSSIRLGMKTIVVWNPKGGSGKSTATVHLATAAELAGHGPVLISDVDKQGTTADWFNQRVEAGLETPRYAPLTIAGLKTQLPAFSKAGAAYLFIDMAAGERPFDADILAYADLVIMPLNPKPADLRALVKDLPTVRKAGKPFHFVLSRVRPNIRNNEGTAQALDVLGLVLPTRLHEREIYSNTFAHGRTALEIDPSGVAAREVAALWADLKKRLDLQNSGKE